MGNLLSLSAQAIGPFSKLRLGPSEPVVIESREDSDQHREMQEQEDRKAAILAKFAGMEDFVPPPRASARAPASLIQDFILESLSFKTMKDREEEVAEAHGSTFDWIFEQEKAPSKDGSALGDKFMRWLSTDEVGSIYWINGKPGSGKSTLMRYLGEHKLTKKHLTKWAGNFPLARASFFFWTSGSQEQRSQTGLLRYILFQLFTDRPDLIGVSFPELWERLSTMSTKERIKHAIGWSVAELITGFHILLEKLLVDTKLCLFIDGLDEFHGDHEDIINLFKGLSESAKVKICLSSRPWKVFEDAFEYSVPTFKLQDLTFDDIYRYVEDNLRGNKLTLQAIDSSPSEAEAFLRLATQRADGVFLWARLAVHELIKGARSGCSIKYLHQTLTALPADLDELFDELLFQRQTKDELSDTADIFQLIRAREIVVDFIKDESANSLTIWELAFALDNDKYKSPIKLDIQEAGAKLIIDYAISTKKRVLERSAGLLEVYAKRDRNQGPRFISDKPIAEATRELTYNKVTYLHRTVRDWLMYAEGVWERLTKSMQKGFDPHLNLLKSYVLRLQHPLEEPEQHRRLDEWWPDIALAMTHARYIYLDPDGLQFALLRDLNRSISWYWRAKSSDDHWARNAFGSYEVRNKTIFHQPFLSLAVKFGLTRYIQYELDAGAYDNIPDDYMGTSLLSYAVEFLCSRQKTIYPLSSTAMVDTLIRHPLFSPNAEYADFLTRQVRTPWIALLRHLRDAKRRRWIEYFDIDVDGIQRWAQIVYRFIDAGADVNAVVLEDRWDPEIRALEVMELLDSVYGAWEVKEIIENMKRLGSV